MNTDYLHCIDLDLPPEGFRTFVSCWLYNAPDLRFVVDPGPLSTIPHLVDRLRELGIDRLDHILLTHIHIDHAGGTGTLLREFPQARVICHPEGVRHMIDPEKLWQGSRQVLGEMADIYGEIIPVPAGNIAGVADGEAVADGRVRAWHTPGHARHHLCFQLGELLFGGEVAGVHVPTDQGIYMRPATPPRFFRDVAIASIEKMLALQPRQLVIAHYGLVEPAATYLEIGRQQIDLWLRGVIELSDGNIEEYEQEFVNWLKREDEHFRLIDRLPPDIVAREKVFLGNSLRGMRQYVDSLDTAGIASIRTGRARAI